MKNIFVFFALSLLTGCTCVNKVFIPTPLGRTMVFIDSNITADVYIGDVNVGTTPYMAKLSGEEREMISLRKSGYKTADLPLIKVVSDFNLLLLRSYTIYDEYYSYEHVYSYSISDIESTCNDNFCDLIMIKRKKACKSIVDLIESRFDFNTNETKRIKQQCENGDMYQYDRDYYFVEMTPKNKESFSEDELKQIRVNLMLEN